MPTPNTNQPADQATADVAAALMACYNPAPLPAAAPLVDRWAEEPADVQGDVAASQRTTPRLLQACFNQ